MVVYPGRATTLVGSNDAEPPSTRRFDPMVDLTAPCWAGIDVGGRRKGFHVALIREAAGRLVVLERPRRCLSPQDVLEAFGAGRPGLVGIDCPRQLADAASRFDGERRLAREVCRLRYTPTLEALERQRLTAAPTYYEWIEHGLELYATLASAGLGTIEAFPTASWTRWAGARNGESRAVWSARALRRLRLLGVARDLDQDERDAIGAAVTAWAHDHGDTEAFGDIIVPLPSRGGPERRADAPVMAPHPPTFGGRRGTRRPPLP
jgi:predicted nuclease with RNAse H fold